MPRTALLFIHQCINSSNNTEQLNTMQEVYSHLKNPKFNLKLFYEDHKNFIDTSPFGQRDKEQLLRNCQDQYSTTKHKHDSCIICFQDLNQEELIAELPVCGHVYHPDCLVPWLEKNSSCPICKAPVRYNLYMMINQGLGNEPDFNR